jgi:hypothetical protein|tara:strand:- start:309 stop:809 length:501 start_codon:yes stop_codon:yes gene_type:complete
MALTQITGSGIGQVTDIKLGGSGSANTISDYEVGTFTPTLVSSGGDSLSIGTASGHYTKIGNVVYFRVQLQNIGTSGTTSSHAVRMFSLPFTIDVTNVNFTVLFDNVTLQGSRTGMVGHSSHTDNYFQFQAQGLVGGDATDTPVDCGDINSGVSDIFGTGFYYTDQ